MKYLSVLFLNLTCFLTLFVNQVHSATPDSLFIMKMQAYEDTLNAIGDEMIGGKDHAVRTMASHFLVKNLVKALKQENSFQYDFSGLRSISVIEPESKKFKIFTWQLLQENLSYRYYGAIQMQGKDLKLFPLVDYTLVIDSKDRIITDNERWLGALYYDILEVSKGKNTYYTLFGYHGANALSTKKMLEVLWFTPEGEVRFGAPIFSFEDDSLSNRVIYEYKEEAAFSLHYDEDQKKIVFDHLIPVDDLSEGYYFNYVPDGSYDGFEWKKGKWQFISKLYDFKLEDGEVPNVKD